MGTALLFPNHRVALSSPRMLQQEIQKSDKEETKLTLQNMEVLSQEPEAAGPPWPNARCLEGSGGDGAREAANDCPFTFSWL